MVKVSELRDLFGSGNDQIVREFGSAFAKKEREWKELVGRLKSFFMPTSYKVAVESIEYGFSFDGKAVPPTPFMRVAGRRHEEKWKAKLDELAARFVLMDEDVKGGVASLEDEIREDLYVSAADYGVPENVSEVFKMKFKKNYRGVQMCEWVHGNSKDPREHHARKWDGHKGKINGRPNGLDGYVFPVDKPPVIDRDERGRETRGFHGDLPHCSCLLVPVFV